MNKAKVKNVLMDKGERYGLIAAGVVMLLFFVLGILEMSNKPDPTADYVDKMEKNTSVVNSTINGNVRPEDVKTLPETITNPKPDPPLRSLWPNHLFFEPNAPPDDRRINPAVLALIAAQIDYMSAKVVAYDIREGSDGQLLIGVLVAPKKSTDKKDEINAQFLSDLRERFRIKGLRTKQNPNQVSLPGQGPMQPGFPQSPYNQPVPPPGGPRMGAGMSRRGGPQHEGGALVDDGERMGIKYVPLDPEKLEGHRFALTIYPQRFVIIQAAFPFKAEIEEIQKALRLQDPLDVFTVYKPEEVPLFRGFEVQRQVYGPDGTTIEEPWADVDFEQSYKEIRRRHVKYVVDDPQVNYVLLHNQHRLVMPLPALKGQNYPAIRVPELIKTMNDQQLLNKPPEAPKPPSQFDSGGSIFDDLGGGNAALNGQPNIGKEGINVGRRPPAGREGEGAKAGALKFEDTPTYKLVRVVDNTIEPGHVYKYRIRIRMQNPNWVGAKDAKGIELYDIKHDLVSRASDADVELLYSDWFEVKDSVSVPQEDFLFGVDPDPKAVPTQRLTPGQGLVQVQRWVPSVTAFGTSKEPVGDWLVADVVATRGTYLGGKQFIKLPLWSSEFNEYILREVDPERGHKDKRQGVDTDPTRPGPRLAVVDVDGGPGEFRPPTRSYPVKDESATEILLMDDSGMLQVRSSYADRFDDKRAQREAAWNAWVDSAKRATKSLVPTTANQDKKDF